MNNKISKIYNYTYADLLNNILIDNKRDRFGNKGDTVSKVLQKNKDNDNLKPEGIYLSKIINFVMPNHIK